MMELKYLIDLFRDDNYKFFYVNIEEGQVIRMDSTWIDGIVEAYDKLIESIPEEKKPNEVVVVKLTDFIYDNKVHNDLYAKSWFYPEEFEYLYNDYKHVCDTFEKLGFFDNGKLDNDTLKKFNKSYNHSTYNINVSLYHYDDDDHDHRVIYVKFEKEAIRNENC